MIPEACCTSLNQRQVATTRKQALGTKKPSQEIEIIDRFHLIPGKKIWPFLHHLLQWEIANPKLKESRKGLEQELTAQGRTVKPSGSGKIHWCQSLNETQADRQY